MIDSWILVKYVTISFDFSLFVKSKFGITFGSKLSGTIPISFAEIKDNFKLEVIFFFKFSINGRKSFY